jgi:putative ABC transport system permease protein
MRPAWRLAISSASGRRERTWLLAAAVTAAAALVSAVACAVASLNAAVIQQVTDTVGEADLRITSGAGPFVPEAALGQARSWPEVARVDPQLQMDFALAATRPILIEGAGGEYEVRLKQFRVTAAAQGVPQERPDLWPERLLAGRLPQAPGEIAIDAMLATRLTWTGSQDGSRQVGLAGRLNPLIGRAPAPLPEGVLGIIPGSGPTREDAEVYNDLQGVRVGDTVTLVRTLRRPLEFTVVGIYPPRPFDGRPRCVTTMAFLQTLRGAEGGSSRLDLVLEEGFDPDAVAAAHEGELEEGLLLQTTARVTGGFRTNMKASELGLVFATILSFLAASFIVLTGLATGVTQQQRELAVARCVGATRWQLAESQLALGGIIGLVGAALGVPAGIGLAWIATEVFRERLPTGLAIPVAPMLTAVAGSIGAGLLGAVWPALRAGRVAPMEAMRVRASAPRMGAILAMAVVGAMMIAMQAAIVGLPGDGQVVFWSHATVGLPLLFVGFFLLGPSVAAGVALALGPGIARLAGLPRKLLVRSVLATPYRFGFTAGAMMAGLALMVALWTNGSAMLRDWLGRMDFPDAFVSGIAITPEHRAVVDGIEGVDATCAVTLLPVATDAFGVRALQSYQTTFVAFEPREFFSMTELFWVEGDEQTAQERLLAGPHEVEGVGVVDGSVIVAREFRTARGLGMGDIFECSFDGRRRRFEIVGVIASPGLELVGKFFNTGEELAAQAMHAVFGSRADMQRLFGVGTINLLQIDLADEADDEQVVRAIRNQLFGAGIMDAGSGRQIKRDIRAFGQSTLEISSVIAIGAMAVASLGVANLVVAGIHARRFEFGVLLAVGAQRGLLARLVLAEAFLVGVAACLLGAGLGLQSAWSGRRLHELLLGITLGSHIPVVAILWSCGALVAMALLAAAPAVGRLSRRRPRELLAAA